MTTMKVELPEIRPEERTPLVEALLAVLRQVLDHVGELEATNQQLRDEVAVLKGQKPRPQLRPSTLTLPAATGAGTSGPGRRRGKPSQPKTSQLTIHREAPLQPAHLPEGAMFKGYEAYVVQDLVIQSDNTKYLRARYDLPEGGSVLAPLPAGVLPVAGGHFGANLVVYILDQYHHAQVTAPLHQEKADVLAAGLAVSSYVGTDDTGARHRGHNGYCTAVGNDLFACFESSASKSRLNFLQVLHGPQRDYALNETAQVYWERQKLPAAVQAALLQGPQAFAGEQAWNTRLAALAIIDERHVRIVTEGALLGGLIARGVSPELAVLSDGAPQFVVLVHAACWVHAERPLAKLVPHNEEHRVAIAGVRHQIWELYQDLRAYREQPQPARRPVLEARFDALVNQRTAYPSINGVLKEMRDPKADLLRVLERPEVPLHNNALGEC